MTAADLPDSGQPLMDRVTRAQAAYRTAYPDGDQYDPADASDDQAAAGIIDTLTYTCRQIQSDLNRVIKERNALNHLAQAVIAWADGDHPDEDLNPVYQAVETYRATRQEGATRPLSASVAGGEPTAGGIPWAGAAEGESGAPTP